MCIYIYMCIGERFGYYGSCATGNIGMYLRPGFSSLPRDRKRECAKFSASEDSVDVASFLALSLSRLFVADEERERDASNCFPSCGDSRHGACRAHVYISVARKMPGVCSGGWVRMWVTIDIYFRAEREKFFRG